MPSGSKRFVWMGLGALGMGALLFWIVLHLPAPSSEVRHVIPVKRLLQ